MQRMIARVIGIALCLAAFGAAVHPEPCAAAGRSRVLERALGSAFAEGDSAQIEQAFSAALRSGVRERVALGIVESCVEIGCDATQIVRVLSLAAQLALTDLPVEGFAAKIEEGEAKGVSPERVLEAAEHRAMALNQARGFVNAAVLGGLEVRDREELTTDLARALEAGRTAEELQEILRRGQAEGWDAREVRRELFR